MTLANFLKSQFTDLVDSYAKYFRKTSGTALTYTVLCFVCIGSLFLFTNTEEVDGNRQVSLLYYVFGQYMVGDTYRLVDLSKIVFILFVSIFSIGLSRFSLNELNEDGEFTFANFVQKLKGDDFFYLIGALIISAGIDYTICSIIKAYNLFASFRWLFYVLNYFRIYFPLIIFSIVIYRVTSPIPIKLNFRKILFLTIAIWLFNVFSTELLSLTRTLIFEFILSPFDESKKYAGESLLGIILVAFYFVGYYSVMTNSLKQFDIQQLDLIRNSELEEPKVYLEQTQTIVPQEELLAERENPKESETIVPNAPYSEYQSVISFCTLSFFSFGLYTLFWFYKHWRYLRDEKGLDISPIWRAIFTLFFGYSLFNEFGKLANDKGYKSNLPFILFFALYLFLEALRYTRNYLILFSIFSFIFLIPMVQMINFYYLKEREGFRIRKGLSKDEVKFLVIFWAFAILISFFGKD